MSDVSSTTEERMSNDDGFEEDDDNDNDNNLNDPSEGCSLSKRGSSLGAEYFELSTSFSSPQEDEPSNSNRINTSKSNQQMDEALSINHHNHNHNNNNSNNANNSSGGGGGIDATVSVSIRIRPPLAERVGSAGVSPNAATPPRRAKSAGRAAGQCRYIRASGKEGLIQCTLPSTAGSLTPSTAKRLKNVRSSGASQAQSPPSSSGGGDGSGKLNFAFDKVYSSLPEENGDDDEDDNNTGGGAEDKRNSQERVFDEMGRIVIAEKIMKGFNGSILCYGQSGSGKTYTMLGPDGGTSLLNSNSGGEEGAGAAELRDRGLLPRMMDYLFDSLNAKVAMLNERNLHSSARESSFKVKMSAVEIYNEDLTDLLPEKVKMPSKKKKAAAAGGKESSAEFRKEDYTTPKDTNLGNNTDDTGGGGGVEPQARSPQRTPTSSLARPGRGGSKSATPARGSISPARTTPAKDLQICYNSKTKQNEIQNLCRHAIRSKEEAMAYLLAVLSRRKMGSTKLNEYSSRSHTLFFIRVEQELFLPSSLQEGEAGGDSNKNNNSNNNSSSSSKMRIVSLLTLGDLAGSERVSHTLAEGKRLTEAKHINYSLSMLAQVIFALTKKQNAAAAAAASGSVAAAAHVPFRNSKLTRLLQTSFTGNNLLFLIVHVAPEDDNILESISSLRFAALAKKIKTQASAQVFFDSNNNNNSGGKGQRGRRDSVVRNNKLIQHYMAEIVLLQKQLKNTKEYAAFLEEQLEARNAGDDALALASPTNDDFAELERADYTDVDFRGASPAADSLDRSSTGPAGSRRGPSPGHVGSTREQSAASAVLDDTAEVNDQQQQREGGEGNEAGQRELNNNNNSDGALVAPRRGRRGTEAYGRPPLAAHLDDDGGGLESIYEQLYREEKKKHRETKEFLEMRERKIMELYFELSELQQQLNTKDGEEGEEEEEEREDDENENENEEDEVDEDQEAGIYDYDGNNETGSAEGDLQQPEGGEEKEEEVVKEEEGSRAVSTPPPPPPGIEETAEEQQQQQQEEKQEAPPTEATPAAQQSETLPPKHKIEKKKAEEEEYEVDDDGQPAFLDIIKPRDEAEAEDGSFSKRLWKGVQIVVQMTKAQE